MKTEVIDTFRGKYDFLSNFYKIRIEFEDFEYPSVEHAYQAAKTLDPVKRHQVCRAHSPAMAKKMGRALLLREDWEQVKVPIMRALLVDKFAYEDLAMRLLDTGDAELEHANYWRDDFWGVYYPPKGNRGWGQNMLGKLLMEIRDEVKKAMGGKT